MNESVKSLMVCNFEDDRLCIVIWPLKYFQSIIHIIEIQIGVSDSHLALHNCLAKCGLVNTNIRHNQATFSKPHCTV